MERNTLSSELIVEKSIIGLSLVFFIFLVVNIHPSARIYFLWLVLVYAAIFYIAFYLPDTIEFDYENLYLIRKSGESTIPLKDIYMIKMTSISIGSRSLWKIKCKINGVEKAARFYNQWFFSSTFDTFCKRVKLMNPRLEVRKFSWSLDFDL